MSLLLTLLHKDVDIVFQMCPNCEDSKHKEYIRLFDVTERTGVRKHDTGRLCHHCQTELKDTIVHFGEKVCNVALFTIFNYILRFSQARSKEYSVSKDVT